MASKRVLVYGGKGALGAVCVNSFKTQKWWVLSVDIGENTAADKNIVIPNTDASLKEQEAYILSEISATLNKDLLDAVVCVAGGWAGGNAASADFVNNCELTWKQSVVSSVLAAAIGAKYLKPGGFLSLTGASAAVEATPGMIGYGMSKAAVHHLTKSLASGDGGLPSDTTTVAILPITLDTPMNRKWMPTADTSTWTPLGFIADLFVKWINGEDRPSNGSLAQLLTKDNVTCVNYI